MQRKFIFVSMLFFTIALPADEFSHADPGRSLWVYRFENSEITVYDSGGYICKKDNRTGEIICKKVEQGVRTKSFIVHSSMYNVLEKRWNKLMTNDPSTKLLPATKSSCCTNCAIM